MRCRHFEDDLALYVEGDLAGSRHRAVEAHLAECGPCRAFVAELRESQAVFKRLRGEMVSAAALGDVRQRVLAEVAGAWAIAVGTMVMRGGGAGVCGDCGCAAFPSSQRRGGCASNQKPRSHRNGADGVVSSAGTFRRTDHPGAPSCWPARHHSSARRGIRSAQTADCDEAADG